MNFVKAPSIDLYPGVVVDENTCLTYDSDTVTQRIENLIMHTIYKTTGKDFATTVDAVVNLSVGDILIFENGGRGYIKPVEKFVTVEDAIADLEALKGME